MSEENTSKNKRKPDYTKGKIYIIRNTQNSSTYIGSTCRTLAQRMAQHRRDMKKHQHFKLYQAMTELGKDAFYIELLEDYPCQKVEELLRREGEKIREHQSELNTTISGRTSKEYRKDNFQHYQELHKEFYERNRLQLIEYQKDYRNKNKDILKLQKQQYCEENKEHIKEQKRHYNHNNKDKIKERDRIYKQKNSEAVKERGRQYYEKNKERINERMKQYRERNKDKIAERQRQLRNEKKQNKTDTEIIE